MKRDVAFRTEDGTLLKGDLHSTEGASRGIVMAHGFSGVRTQIDHYAARFAADGCAVLVYDHRGFGDSEGAPRHEVDPGRQLADWQDAITFAMAQPEFAGLAGVGVWGSSFAGGLAMVLAANDDRVTCVVAQIPHVSGHRNARAMFNATERERLRGLMLGDRAARAAGAEPMRVPVFATAEGELSALPPAISRRNLDTAIRYAPTWANDVTLRSVEHMMRFEPAGWAPYIAPKPFLMIVAANDVCTFPDNQLDAFERALGPKRLLVHRGGHFDTYTDHFAETSDAASRWFREHL